MEWDIFFGRFHPLIVHLPIGFIVLGFMLELAALWSKSKASKLNNYILIAYSAGWIGGVLAIASGLMLSGSNAYGGEALDSHKTFGIAAVILLTLWLLAKWFIKDWTPKLQALGSVMVIACIGVTGHLGGTLTHGDEYLYEYAPESVKMLVGYKNQKLDFTEFSADSVVIYRDIVRPILTNKCVECHNDDEAKGGFNSSSYASLFVEAEHEMPVIAGNPYASELFNRISLPTYDKKFMPLNNRGMGYTDLLIFKYWIANGADSISYFEHESMSLELMELLLRDYGLDYFPKPYYEQIIVDRVNDKVLQSLDNEGFAANYLSADNNLLDVSFRKDTITQASILGLSDAQENITFLDLSKAQLSDDLVASLPYLEHLTRIILNENPISDSVYYYLNQHKHLESISLHSTNITNAGLRKIAERTTAKRIYVWNTGCTDQFIEEISQQFDQLEIVSGFTFEKIAEADEKKLSSN